MSSPARRSLDGLRRPRAVADHVWTKPSFVSGAASLDVIKRTVNRRLRCLTAARTGEPSIAGEMQSLRRSGGCGLRRRHIRERANNEPWNAGAIRGIRIRSTGKDGTPAWADIRVRVEGADDNRIGHIGRPAKVDVRLSAARRAPRLQVARDQVHVNPPAF